MLCAQLICRCLDVCRGQACSKLHKRRSRAGQPTVLAILAGLGLVRLVD